MEFIKKSTVKYIVIISLTILFNIHSAVGACGFRTFGDPPPPTVFFTLAVFSSTTLPSQVSSEVSGTSGCKSSVSFMDWEQQKYVFKNYNFLLEESSKGHGQHLQGFAILVGCPKTNQKIFSLLLHTNYRGLFDEDSKQVPERFLLKLRALVQNHPQLSRSCALSDQPRKGTMPDNKAKEPHNEEPPNFASLRTSKEPNPSAFRKTR